MPRLNPDGPSNSERNGRGGVSNIVSRNLTFVNVFGMIMAALSLKEYLDKKKSANDPCDSEHALLDTEALPAYRDHEDGDEAGVGGSTSLPMLVTEIPMTSRAKVKRRRNCCVCCGVRCDLFCKAFGLAVLFFLVWNTFKLIKWAVTPSPTGLEKMPEFSTSLGCTDAPHFFKNTQDVYYSLPIASNGSEALHNLKLEVRGGAVGTLLLAPSQPHDVDQDNAEIKLKASIRTSDATLLSAIVLSAEGPRSSTSGDTQTQTYSIALQTSDGLLAADACTRFDLTLYLPQRLHAVSISSQSVMQVKFDDSFPENDSKSALSELSISLSSRAYTNMILPSTALVADNVDISSRGGYVVGSLALANSTKLDTGRGDAITKLDYAIVSSRAAGVADSDASPVYLSTTIGAGRSDFAVTRASNAHQRIHAEHDTQGLVFQPVGDLRLTYSNASFNGGVELNARSYSAKNLQGGGLNADPSNKDERWAGERDGGDSLKVTTSGWVGLYF